jgi:hypothetical protein
MCKLLGEGNGWKASAKSPGAGDGGLDVVVWRKFTDQRPGGLLGFAQCKTGDGWHEHLGRKSPRAFHHTYFSQALVVDPLHLFLVPCRIHESSWEAYARQANGLLFDRCRITLFGNNVRPTVLADCKTWLNEALRLEQKRTSKLRMISRKSARRIDP